MVLTSCRECEQRVSTEAVACPHCGAPRPATGNFRHPDADSVIQPREAHPTAEKDGAPQATKASQSSDESPNPPLTVPSEQDVLIGEKTPADKTETEQAPHGVGGWLLLFAIGLIALAPLWNVGDMMSTWDELKPVWSRFSEQLKAAVWVEFAWKLIITLYGIVVGLVLASGSQKGKRWSVRYLIVRLMLSMGMLLLAGSLYLSAGLTPSMEASIVGELFSMLILELGFFAVWYSYFRKSKRVAATFRT